jgi:hypothetical protein
MPLTADKASRILHSTLALVLALPQRAADGSRVAPHHLREVAPRSLEGGVVVRVLDLLFVPAVGGGACELDPVVVVGWGTGSDGGEVAAGALLLGLVMCATRSWGYGEEGMLVDDLHVPAYADTC